APAPTARHGAPSTPRSGGVPPVPQQPSAQQPSAQQPSAQRPAPPPGGPVQAPSIVPLDLDQAALVRPRKEAPANGWRRAVYKASFGGINPGISREQSEKNALVERIRTPIRGCHKIAVVSLKGGIGKTTTTSCLGLTLAHYRGDRVVALDANPDAGTLAERLTGVTDVSVRDLLENLEQVQSFTDISRYMSLANRLQVLASDQDAEVSEAFDAEQYTRVTALLSRYYNVILTDSGTGMLHSAMRGTLEAADSLVVVGAPSVDGSSRAAKTLDWLVAHGYGDLVSGAVAVISSVREKSDSVDMEVLRNHFGARCRAVIEIPYDPHLVIGGRIDMSQIRPRTERAYLELAAAVADGFRRPR
uniref:MinD/ParA family ATP-binding protein n=1 Tax=Cumulibacter manganitolerans TaxID=1884992 RepID=UPI001E397613